MNLKTCLTRCLPALLLAAGSAHADTYLDTPEGRVILFALPGCGEGKLFGYNETAQRGICWRLEGDTLVVFAPEAQRYPAAAVQEEAFRPGCSELTARR